MLEETAENAEPIVDEEIVEEVEAVTEAEVDEPEAEVAEPTEEEDDPEVIVTFGDEESPSSEEAEKESESKLLNSLRKKNRKDVKRVRELEKRLAELEKVEKPELGAKPTLEAHEYDAAAFEKALEDWYERKREHDAENAEAEKKQERFNNEYQEKLDSYAEAKTKLKVKDFEDSEEAVLDAFDVTKQSVIVRWADNPSALVYALGKNPKKLNELAQIDDMMGFAFAVARMEKQLKVTPRKPAAAPEKTVSGSASSAGSNATLEKLRSEAERTGDFSKVMAYKRQLRNKK